MVDIEASIYPNILSGSHIDDRFVLLKNVLLMAKMTFQAAQHLGFFELNIWVIVLNAIQIWLLVEFGEIFPCCRLSIHVGEQARGERGAWAY